MNRPIGARLIHIVGPQGSGKTTLAETIAQGLRHAGQYADVIDLDDAGPLATNEDIRRSYAAKATVILCAQERQIRHDYLQPGDLVLTLERGGLRQVGA